MRERGLSYYPALDQFMTIAGALREEALRAGAAESLRCGRSQTPAEQFFGRALLQPSASPAERFSSRAHFIQPLPFLPLSLSPALPSREKPGAPQRAPGFHIDRDAS